jgi:hypothetical protein
LIPDPTAVISAALPTLIPDSSVSTPEFMARTAELFPWLPHGNLGRAVASKMRDVPDPGSDTRASEGLSLALLRLDTEQRVRLEPGDDPRQRVLLTLNGAPERGIARITLT